MSERVDEFVRQVLLAARLSPDGSTGKEVARAIRKVAPHFLAPQQPMSEESGEAK